MLKFKLNNKAFSLLELVITIAVLSIGITVIMQAFSYSAKVTGLYCDIIKALFLAEDKMQELEYQEKTGLSGKIQNEPGVTNGKFQWKYSVTPVMDLNLERLDFKISWDSLNRKETINLSTYLRK